MVVILSGVALAAPPGLAERSGAASTTRPAGSSTATSGDSATSLPALAALASPAGSSSPFLDLPVQGFRSSVVSLPIGATSRRPILVATHDAGDRPEWQCHVWRGIVKNRGFVLCPRGYPTNPYVPPEHTGFFYTDHHSLGREISRAIDALVARFPDHVDKSAPAYAGFSQGAIQGAILLPNHPARFSRAALIEGGYGFFQEWNIPVSERWKKNGGDRVLLACGRLKCAEQARTTAYYMRRGGLVPRVLYVEGAGHSYGGAMEQRVKESFEWLIEGDPRWSL